MGGVGPIYFLEKSQTDWLALTLQAANMKFGRELAAESACLGRGALIKPRLVQFEGL